LKNLEKSTQQRLISSKQDLQLILKQTTLSGNF